MAGAVTRGAADTLGVDGQHRRRARHTGCDTPRRRCSLPGERSGALVVFIYMIIALAHIRCAARARQAAHPRPRSRLAVPWLSYAPSRHGAWLVGMALTPGEMAQQLFWSVVSLAVASAPSWSWTHAQGATVARTVARTAPAPGGGWS